VNFTDFLMFVGSTSSVRELYNQTIADLWDEIRDFIALHYKFNTRIDTPYWRHCRSETDISGSEKLLSFYSENGPTNFNRAYLRSPGSKFGIEGFLVILVGNKVACKNRYVPTEAERRLFDAVRTRNRMTAKAGLTVEQSLAYIRHPNWRWAGENPG
jgi:tryptophan halogenase